MALTNFTPIDPQRGLSRPETVAQALADYLAEWTGRGKARLSSGLLLARGDLIVCVSGEGGDLLSAAPDRDWCAILLRWNVDRPGKSLFNLVVRENGRIEYFADLRLLIDEPGRAQFVPRSKGGVGVMIGKSGPVPGAHPDLSGEAWGAAEQRALNVLFGHEDAVRPSKSGIDGRLVGPGIRTFQNIARLWGLTQDEAAQLLGPQGPAIYQAEEAGEPLPITHETLMRISAVFGIYAALESLLPQRSGRWIQHPNHAQVFAGRRPLELMMSEKLEDVIGVRRYLDAQFT